MDTLKLPMRDIQAKYTKSELVCMSWESKEKSYLFSQRTKNRKDIRAVRDKDSISHRDIEETETTYQLPDGVNQGVGLPKKLFNEEGELDLRKSTGPEALGYIRAIGINIVPVMRF